MQTVKWVWWILTRHSFEKSGCCETATRKKNHAHGASRSPTVQAALSLSHSAEAYSDRHSKTNTGGVHLKGQLSSVTLFLAVVGGVYTNQPCSWGRERLIILMFKCQEVRYKLDTLYLLVWRWYKWWPMWQRASLYKRTFQCKQVVRAKVKMLNASDKRVSHKSRQRKRVSLLPDTNLELLRWEYGTGVQEGKHEATVTIQGG